MSYDLYFYKQKKKSITEFEIANYLTINLVAENENGNQWFFENKDTEVYFSIEKNDFGKESKSDEEYESFEKFENTNFSFNLNFMRPSFFGLEAFKFIDKFISDLDLFVLNPQLNSETPYKPGRDDLFEDWNLSNLRISIDQYERFQSSYLPLNKSNESWEYNFNRKRLQDQLGEEYFVPRLFFLKTKGENKVITFTSWTQHIPTVLPPADYFILGSEYKKLFRTIKKDAIIDRETLLMHFGSDLEDFNFKGCKIIHPKNAMNIKDKFNSIRSELQLETFAERLPMEKLYNAKPH